MATTALASCPLGVRRMPIQSSCFRRLPERRRCSGRSRSESTGVLTVSAIKPTLGLANSAGPSGSYAKYSLPWVATGRFRCSDDCSPPREMALPIQSTSTTPGMAIAASANGVIRNRVSSVRTVVEAVTHPVERSASEASMIGMPGLAFCRRLFRRVAAAWGDKAPLDRSRLLLLALLYYALVGLIHRYPVQALSGWRRPDISVPIASNSAESISLRAAG